MSFVFVVDNREHDVKLLGCLDVRIRGMVCFGDSKDLCRSWGSLDISYSVTAILYSLVLLF